MSYDDEEGPLRGQHVDDGEHEPRCEEQNYFGFTIPRDKMNCTVGYVNRSLQVTLAYLSNMAQGSRAGTSAEL